MLSAKVSRCDTARESPAAASYQTTFIKCPCCLTNKRFSHKLCPVTSTQATSSTTAAHTHEGLNALDALEQRVVQLLGQFDTLRLENHALRGKLVDLSSERDQLQARIDAAAERLEALHDRLPAE